MASMDSLVPVHKLGSPHKGFFSESQESIEADQAYTEYTEAKS